jgi:hypothetical protein
MEILSAASLLPQYIFLLFNSYSKLMKILSGTFLPPQYISRIQLLFKIDGNPLCSLLSPPVPIPDATLMQILCKSSLKPLFHPNTYSLFNSYSKIDGNPLWSLPSPPVHNHYSVLIQN